jgi:hypothetical protein
MACVKKLSEYFEKGNGQVEFNAETDKDLGLTSENRHTILSTMEQIGVIVVDVIGDYQLSGFEISPAVIQVARAIRDKEKEAEAAKKERRDIVAEVKEKAATRPALAWIIIGFIILTALATFLNQVAQLLERFGVIHPAAK